MRALNRKITDWNGRRIWVIGASSGIGAALARHLQTLGARVALSARRGAELTELGIPGSLVLPLDVTDAKAVDNAHERLKSDWNGIDLVIYCAGTYVPMRAWDIDLEVTKTTLDVNLLGVYNLLQAAIPHFLEQKAGGICVVASIAGVTGLPKALCYGPSKAALINLAEVLYADLAPRGIDVYLINPGFVDTRLTKKNDFTMPSLITPEKAAEEIVDGLGRGRFEIHFPRRFTLWIKTLALLPQRFRFYLLKRIAAT